ncbi:hypothetical protein MKX08_003306 [Trichoderma sp. CBMAI-0020]|nr:hypothetical protein MKX08_003306 [Trichoderma sp. CBMAI-0020]
MDAIDLMVLNKSLVAAAAGAASSITQLHSIIVDLQDRRDPINQLYEELDALGQVLEALRMSLDGSLSRSAAGYSKTARSSAMSSAEPSAWVGDDIQHDLIAVSDAAAYMENAPRPYG